MKSDSALPRAARLLSLIASLIAAAATAAQSQPAPDIVEIDRIVAVVNDDVIVHSEMQSRHA